MKRYTSLLLLSLLHLINLQSQCPETISNQVDSLINAYSLQGKFNGNLLLCLEGEVVCNKQAGYSDPETKYPLDSTSLFCLASISKIFTSTAIIMLQREGKINIEEPVTLYLKELPDAYNSVKIRNLLSHTSGIPEISQDWRTKIGMHNSDVYHFVVQQSHLDFEPGSRYSYSNTGYTLLAVLIDSLSGTSYKEYIESKIFTPLGMKNSFVIPPDRESLSSLPVKSYVGGKQADWPSFTYGPGGIYSTTGDLEIWDRAFFNGEVFDNELISTILKPFELNNGTPVPYGLGWGVIKTGNITLAGHTGGMFGFRNIYEREIEKELTLIILTNIGDSTPIMEIRGKVIEIANKYLDRL